MSRQAFQIFQIALISISISALILNLSRRRLITFSYTVGWLSLCGVALLGSLLVPLVEPISRFLKVEPFTVVGGSAVLILLAICVQLTVSISGLHRQLNQVNEAVALLRDKVENDSTR